MADTFDRLKTALSDRYTIERELGAGGMAVVYLAQDLKHERQVAVKVLRPELAAAVGAERFQQEIKIAANLNHPHVLPLLDSGESGGFLYYVMPYVEGQSLRDKLAKEGELPIVEAVKILREVVDALAHAHENNVVHRDIKPENVMLSSGGAVVADFGIARAVTVVGGEQLTETGMAVGTPAYMSPEKFTESRRSTASTCPSSVSSLYGYMPDASSRRSWRSVYVPASRIPWARMPPLWPGRLKTAR